MMIIALRLLSLLGLKSRWPRHFSPRPLNEVFFQGEKPGDSWTLCPKPLRHRHPTGPHPRGLWWTPAKGDSTKSSFALDGRSAADLLAHLALQELAVLEVAVERAVVDDHVPALDRDRRPCRHRVALPRRVVGLVQVGGLDRLREPGLQQ